MKRGLGGCWGWAWLACGLWVLAVGQGVRTLALARRVGARDAIRRDVLRALEPSMRRLTVYGGLRAHWMELLDAGASVDVNRWHGALNLPPPWPEVSEEARQSADGWTVLRVRMQWASIALEDVGAVMASAENLPVPLRVEALTLDPITRDGQASVSVDFYTLSTSP